MSTTQLSKDNVVQITKQTRPSFMKTSSIEWVPWVMEGTHFKLLAIDERSGGFTMLLKVDPGKDAPPHYHVGSVEGVILEGEFGYDDDRGGVGDYICEHGGVVHQPDSPRGTVMFAVVHGPLAGYNPDGSIAAIVDAKLMLQMAQDAGQAGHLDGAFAD